MQKKFGKAITPETYRNVPQYLKANNIIRPDSVVKLITDKEKKSSFSYSISCPLFCIL